jgi:hypothetical protein
MPLGFGDVALLLPTEGRRTLDADEIPIPNQTEFFRGRSRGRPERDMLRLPLHAGEFLDEAANPHQRFGKAEGAFFLLSPGVEQEIESSFFKLNLPEQFRK